MTALLQDLRYTLRSLRRSPGFTAVVVLTLALGIGATSAIWSVVYGVLLKPLAYPQPEQLVYATSQFPSLGFDQFWVSAAEFLEYQEQSRSFASLGAYRGGAVNLSDARNPIRINVAQTSAELLAALGVAPVHGRLFAPEDDQPGAPPVVILSYPLWQQAFAGDPAAVGRSVEVDGTPTTVIGVMPPGFDIRDEGYQAWLPLAIDRANPGPRYSHSLYLIGRLAPGVSFDAAKAELETLLVKWDQEATEQHHFSPSNHRLRLDALHEDMVAGVRKPLWMLLGVVGLVLLIACANVANLLLVRAESRRQEIAVRTAIGAGRPRLLRQFLTEGAVLGLLGGGLGLVLASIGLKLTLAINPESLPRSGEVGLDGAVLAFTLLLALGTGLVFGLVPAFHLSNNLAGAIKEGGERSAGGSRHHLQRFLAAFEIALAVAVVISAGLLLRSFWNILQVDAGFRPAQLVTFRVALPESQYPQDRDAAAFFDRLLDRLRALPGVEAASAMAGLPPNRPVDANTTEFEGLQETPDGPPHNVDYWQYVSSDYFETMGIPLVEGRLLTPQDVAGAPQVVVVNQALARTFYGDENPIGRRLRSGVGDFPWRTIVGVVKDVKQRGLDQPAGTEFYTPMAQAPDAMPYTPREMYVVLRSPLPFEALAQGAREAVRDLDPGLPVADLQPMEQVFQRSVSRPRFLASLLAAFAAVALALAAIGTYGVLAIQVAERSRELGIRMALGAAPSRVQALVLRQGMTLAGLGLAAGLVLAVILTQRLMPSLLFGVGLVDPITFITVPALLAAVAFIACYLPARRATRVDPVRVLRHE